MDRGDHEHLSVHDEAQMTDKARVENGMNRLLVVVPALRKTPEPGSVCGWYLGASDVFVPSAGLT